VTVAMQPFRSATIPVDRLLLGIHGLRGIAPLRYCVLGAMVL